MAVPDWALVLLVAYPLAQIPLVLYLARWFELDGDAPVVTPTRAYWNGGTVEEPGVQAGGGPPGRCRHCGTVNDPSYTFCRHCVASLA